MVRRMRFIKLQEVIDLTGRSRSKTYADIAAGKFPRPVKNGKSSRWVDEEVLLWMSERIIERDADK